jgi:putative ABC transport system ATP-binding protein
MDSLPKFPAEPLIRLRGLTKVYPEGEKERVVLRGVDADFHRGEFVALVGRSGSGKSTLLNLISGIDPPTSGEVVVGGTDLTRLSEQNRTLFRRSHVGFIFQFYNLIPTLTVMENLLLPLELKGRIGAEERSRARELLSRIALGDRGESYPDRLSGGEQQRLAIARALVHRPRILLADEPTGNLDAETGASVMELLSAMVREAGMTLLLVTHSRDVTALADRTLTVRDGVLLEEGE